MTGRDASPPILIVEPDPFMRPHQVQVVSDAGYNTLEAGNALEALHTLQRHPECRAAVIEIMLPGAFDGFALAAAIRQLQPEIELVLMSPRWSDLDQDRPDRSHFLAKPFAPDDLLRLLL